MSIIPYRHAGPTRRPNGFTAGDVLVLLFLMALLLVTHAELAHQAREGSGRIKCAGNLREIGQAMTIYANSNKGVFARTIFDETANPVPIEYTGTTAPNPFGAGGPMANDVTAPVFL